MTDVDAVQDASNAIGALCERYWQQFKAMPHLKRTSREGLRLAYLVYKLRQATDPLEDLCGELVDGKPFPPDPNEAMQFALDLSEEVDDFDLPIEPGPNFYRSQFKIVPRQDDA